MKRCVLTFALGFLVVLPLSAQDTYPSKQETRAVLKDVDYAMRRFKEVTGQINFGKWKASYERVTQTQKGLDRKYALTEKSQTIIAELERTQGRISSADLFLVYNDLESTYGHLQQLANKEAMYGGDDALVNEMEAVLNTLLDSSLKLSALLWRQLGAQELELGRCRRSKR